MQALDHVRDVITRVELRDEGSKDVLYPKIGDPPGRTDVDKGSEKTLKSNARVAWADLDSDSESGF